MRDVNHKCFACKHTWTNTKYWDQCPKCIDSVAQGHTRDDPQYASEDYGTFDYTYDLPDLPDLIKKDEESRKKDNCRHEWEITGYSPLDNRAYENCKKCDIRREDVEDK